MITAILQEWDWYSPANLIAIRIFTDLSFEGPAYTNFDLSPFKHMKVMRPELVPGVQKKKQIRNKSKIPCAVSGVEANNFLKQSLLKK